MSDQEQDFANETVHEIMTDIMAVLYSHGYTKMSVGAMMRLLGVHNNAAAQHDDEYIDLEESFEEFAQKLQSGQDVEVPPGTTYH